MDYISFIKVLAAFGIVMFEMGASQIPSGLGGFVPPEFLTGPVTQADVLNTVVRLLSETGHSSSASNLGIQEIVSMLMNGTAPSGSDLARLGITPQQITTPPPYTIPKNPIGSVQTGVIPVIGLSSLFQSGQPIGTNNAAPSSVSNVPGSPIGETNSAGVVRPINDIVTGSTNSSSSVPLGIQAAEGLPTPAAPVADPTTPKPILGDPFSLNLGASNVAPPLNHGLDMLSVLEAKPTYGLDTTQGLGVPGPSSGSLGSLGFGSGSFQQEQLPTLQTGVMDSRTNQHNQHNSNPMMMMYMMNPEVTETMMADNPMMTYMMMQQMSKPRQVSEHTQTSLPNLPGLSSLQALTSLHALPNVPEMSPLSSQPNLAAMLNLPALANLPGMPQMPALPTTAGLNMDPLQGIGQLSGLGQQPGLGQLPGVGQQPGLGQLPGTQTGAQAFLSQAGGVMPGAGVASAAAPGLDVASLLSLMNSGTAGIDPTAAQGLNSPITTAV